MGEVAFLLYWYVIFLLLGCLFGFVLRVRLRWLVLAVSLLLLPFWIPVGESAADKAVIGLITAGYVMSWAAGLVAGRRLRGSSSAGHPPGAGAS